jgi:GAF domain-containing protein
MPSHPRVRLAMDALAHTLTSPERTDQALLVLTEGAVHAIPGAGYASISQLERDGRLATVAETDPLIRVLDAHQYALREGPCYDTVTDASFSVTLDLAHDPRWPRYGPLAARAGVHAQLAVLLSTSNGDRTALNVYSAEPHDFSHESIETAEVFASHAAVAMGFVHTIKNLGVAIGTRQTIGQAVGILMERYQIDERRAFSFLVRASSHSNVKLRDVAADIVTGLNRRTRA